MRPIDLVKQNTKLLPGLERAFFDALLTLNKARRLLNLPEIQAVQNRPLTDTVMGRMIERKREADRLNKKIEEADKVRAKIAQREEDARLKARNVKTLVKRRRA